MASPGHPEFLFLPPSYSEATRQHASLGGGLSFVDFIPGNARTFVYTRNYPSFRTLIIYANRWLQEHPDMEAKTCESVEFKHKSDQINLEKMTYLEYGRAETKYVRGLRLWVVPQVDRCRPPQQIDYINLVPEQKSNSGVSATFESLNEVLQKFNDKINTNPLPGRIITVESQEMKLPDCDELDPDKTVWVEHGDYSRHFLFIVRIFYEISISTKEEIGMKDFLPKSLQGGSFSFYPKFEQFSSVINQASRWCLRQSGLRFCNAQCLEIKIKSGGTINPQKMSYTEHGRRRTSYVRILRVAYVKCCDEGVNESCLEPPTLHLTCKTFAPVRLTQGLFVPEFEGLTSTRKRIEAWVKTTGARVLSAQTAAIRLLGSEIHTEVEDSFTYNDATRNEYWMLVIRLYLDGSYQEPSPDGLPSLPAQNEDYCTIL